MDVRIKLGSNWSSKVSQIYMNIGGVWQSIKSGYINIGTWQQFFLRIATPVNTVKPVVTGSTYLYGTLSGTLGTWTAPNGTNSYSRQWQRADYDGSSTPGTFSSISGATSSTYTTTINDNGKWIRLRVTATNLSGSDTAFSELDYIRKYSPVALTIPVISGSASVNSTLTALTTVGTYWKNTTTNSGDTSPDTFSYRWYWGDTNETKGSNSSTYLVGNDDIGHTIRVDVTAINTGGDTVSTSAQTSTVGQAVSITNVIFKDSNDESGFNNRSNLVTASGTKLLWTVTGVNTGTTFRVRYRVFNNQTSAYWNPDTLATAAASAAWVSYESDYYNNGNISNVTISGTTATLYDFFTIPELFNGSTYGGGISRWSWEYEISIVNGGTRFYWSPGDYLQTSQTNDYYDIDPTSIGTIAPASQTVNTSTAVTFSGTLNSYPAGLTSYPYAYRVVYGDGNNSGYQTFSYGQINPSYSKSHTYSSTGSYSAYIETVPGYTYSYSNITVSNAVTPTITMNGNTNISSTGARINWSSTNQSYAYVDSTYVGNVNSYTFSGLSSSTSYSGTVTVYSSTGDSASASYSFTTTSSFVTPSISLTTNPPAFARGGSSNNIIAWGWNNASYSGSTSGNPSYPWRIRSGSSSGTIIASGTRSYNSGFVSVGGNSYNYRIGSEEGDTPRTTSGRWGSYQATILGTNGQTYSTSYSASV